MLTAVSFALYAWPEVIDVARGQDGALGVQQASTYEALIRAAARAPGTKIDAGDAEGGRQRFEENFYNQLPTETRSEINAVLEALEHAPSDEAFSDRSAQANHELLQAFVAARTAEERRLEQRSAEFAQGHPSAGAGREETQAWLESRSRLVQRHQDQLRERYGEDPATLDPDNGFLVRYASPRPGPPPSFPDSRGTEAARDRALAGAALMLAAVPFYPDRVDPPV